MPPSGGTEPVTAGVQPFQSSSEINININFKDVKSNIYGAIAYATIYFSVYWLCRNFEKHIFVLELYE